MDATSGIRTAPQLMRRLRKAEGSKAWLHRGNRTENSVPSSCDDATLTVPPCASVIALTMYRPRPKLASELLLLTPLVSGSNKVSRASGGSDVRSCGR
jgi:hypothetical protein